MQNEQQKMRREYLSVQEASEITGLSVWTWRNWAYID
jgi:hypothetical protein